MECLDIMRRLWQGTTLDYQSEYFQIHGIALPKPLQAGGPPVWLGARVPAAVRRAAEHTDGWLTSYNSSVTDLQTLIPIYREACAARAEGYHGHVALIREGFVAESFEHARALIQEPLMAQYLAYAEWKKGEDKYSARTFDELTARMILGSPEDCIRKIQQYEQLGIDSLLLVFQQPGLGSHDVLTCMRRFAKQVIPAFAREREVASVTEAQ
jgi:alkanesulfonate monooxygenase SsuD/methylene tetrahydromethanopterin reductase-like flavin-dependent oxidoreductase (luciferase family)